MPHSDWSFIGVELVLVFGGALAFGWWQLRDVAREQAKRKAQAPAALIDETQALSSSAAPPLDNTPRP